MRRADRLFQIVQHLRARRLTTAGQLAEWLLVSTRTIYRDIQDLERSGVPIEGEAGVGYRIAAGFDLPPLMFGFDEVQALVAGLRLIQTWGGLGLAGPASAALAKITLALPPQRRSEIERTPLHAPSFHLTHDVSNAMETLRHAIAGRFHVLLDYLDLSGRSSLRTVRPLGLYFWGQVWTLAAWCELRTEFRSFRLDRMRRVVCNEQTHPDEAGRRLADFVRLVSTTES